MAASAQSAFAAGFGGTFAIELEVAATDLAALVTGRSRALRIVPEIAATYVTTLCRDRTLPVFVHRGESTSLGFGHSNSPSLDF
jgi:hypothetical protein